jgi:hypothetical protein
MFVLQIKHFQNNKIDIGGIVDHHCLEVIVCFVDIGGIVDHHCLNILFLVDPIITIHYQKLCIHL